MKKKSYRNPTLAEDIVSLCMVDEETRLRDAVEQGRFYSVILLNRCRDYFDMKHEKKLDPTKCNGYVGAKRSTK